MNRHYSVIYANGDVGICATPPSSWPIHGLPYAHQKEKDNGSRVVAFVPLSLVNQPPVKEPMT